VRCVAEILRDAATRLEGVTETPRLDAELLLAHALGTTRAALLARLRERAPEDAFAPLLARRLEHEPIAYIVGTWEFFSLPFRIRPPTLVPRPETEHLVEEALRIVRAVEAPRVLDVATGSGCIAVSIACNAPACHVTATDIHPGAVELAQENAAAHGVAGRVAVGRGDLFEALPRGTPPFHVICANPPYVAESAWASLPPVIRLHEDPGALLAGADGLAVVERLLKEARGWLVPGGSLLCEIGEDQHESAGARARSAGYQDVHFLRDLAGHARVLAAVRA
jgi:release factor glutamine methyltransferase